MATTLAEAAGAVAAAAAAPRQLEHVEAAVEAARPQRVRGGRGQRRLDQHCAEAAAVRDEPSDDGSCLTKSGSETPRDAAIECLEEAIAAAPLPDRALPPAH